MKKLDIFEDENSIIIDDQYDTTSFTFYPEEKKFEVSRSVKNDAYYNNQVIQYKISTNPVEIQMRTLESSHEPPLEYSIRDGVVMESEIKKENPIFPDRIERLKKEVEWSVIEIFGNYEVNLFILSKHPELLPKEDYRRFLRQSVERIRAGLSKIEEAVKNDSHGLQLHTGTYGKSIWYPESEVEKKESEEYWKLSKEKREKSDYAKKLKYIEDFKNSLFTQTSSAYAGITEFEFQNGTEILSYVDGLLNKKEIPVAKKEEPIKAQGGQTNKVISVLIYLLTAFFVILRLTDGIDWSWIAIFAPVVLWEGLGFIVGFLRAFAK